MPMVPFFTRFPEIAERETRSVFLKNHEGLPDGEYAFLEHYCDEPGCDCERVIVNVVTPKRPTEPLAIIGNLAPLVGLAGTVWGMILAFASLSAAGGRASPTELSLGISKALMHTLLGLMLAIPALAFAAFFRARIERAIGRAAVVCAEAVDRLASSSAGGSSGRDA